MRHIPRPRARISQGLLRFFGGGGLVCGVVIGGWGPNTNLTDQGRPVAVATFRVGFRGWWCERVSVSRARRWIGLDSIRFATTRTRE